MSIILSHFQPISTPFHFFDSSIYSSHNPLLWESNYLNFSSQLIQQLFIDYLRNIDECFFHSDERKNSYYSKDKQPRTLVTLFGTITFTRRRYTNRSTGNSFHYIDYLLGISQYQRVTNQVVSQIFHNVSCDHDSYRKATQPFGLSKSFAYYQIKKLKTDVFMPYLNKPITCDNLHIALQNKNKPRKRNSINSYMLRHVTIFTEITKICKNRNKLENRMILTQRAISNFFI